MLTIEDVTVRYGTAVAVKQVSLTVSDRSVVALLGPSGCGKSTLLRAVAGLEPVAAGRITWDGLDLARVPVHRRGFGLMFQDGALFPHRDVAGNIAYGLERSGQDRSAIRERVGELLDLVGLAGTGNRAVGTLSGGQQQRVALARALAPRPRLLLLDEPLAALDRSLRERLLADLREVLRQTGTTALYVTHDQTEAFALADTVALMNDGVLRQVGLPPLVWRHPVDEWVAGFVGYDSIVEAAVLRSVPGIPGSWKPAAPRIALRPAAFVAAEDGPIDGQVEDVLPGPELTRLRVRVGAVGIVTAVSAAAPGEVTAGDRVALRFDPEQTATVPG